MTTTNYEGWTIKTGWLTGNCWGGHEDFNVIDAEASLSALYDQTEAALKERFPGAEVDIHTENATGVVPHSCRTAVYAPDGYDGDEWEGELEDLVDDIVARVYEQYDWIVELAQRA